MRGFSIAWYKSARQSYKLGSDFSLHLRFYPFPLYPDAVFPSGKIEIIPESVGAAEEIVKAEGNEAQDQLQREDADLSQTGLSNRGSSPN